MSRTRSESSGKSSPQGTDQASSPDKGRRNNPLFRGPDPSPSVPGLVGSLDPGASVTTEGGGPTPTSPAPSWSEGAASGPGGDGYETGSPSISSGRRSTAKRGHRKRELKKLCGHAVMTVGGMLNAFLTAADTPERDGGLWVPDRQDVGDIADPVAGLASRRRLPEGVDDNPDAADLVRLVMALGAYVGKQLRRKTELGGIPRTEGPFMDPGAFDSGDPDRWGPTVDQGDDEGDDEERRKGDAHAQARGFLGRRFGGQTPTAPTTADRKETDREDSPA